MARSMEILAAYQEEGKLAVISILGHEDAKQLASTWIEENSDKTVLPSYKIDRYTKMSKVVAVCENADDDGYDYCFYRNPKLAKAFKAAMMAICSN